MAKKTITKAESLAAKTERLMQAYFDLQDKMKEAERELREHVAENEAKMFAQGQKYTVRYGEITLTNTQNIEFESKVSYSPMAVIDLFSDAQFSKICKKEFGKIAFEGLLDKANVIAILNQGEDKKFIKALRNYGILGVSTSQRVSFKQIKFASDEQE
jgi:hypothetical protein